MSTAIAPMPSSPLGSPAAKHRIESFHTAAPHDKRNAHHHNTGPPADVLTSGVDGLKPSGAGAILENIPVTVDKAGIHLIRAVTQNLHQELVDVLKTPGINIESRDKNGRTVLYIACFNGFNDCVKILLAHGASVKSYTPSGKSVLSAAVTNNHYTVVKMLLANPECDINHQDNAGTTALMLACEVTRPPGASLKLVELLIGPIGDVRVTAQSNPELAINAPVSTSAEASSEQNGPKRVFAMVGMRDFNQMTAFDRCCRSNDDPKVAALLVRAGATVIQHCDGKYAQPGHHYATTSLMNAAMNGNKKTVEWLLVDHGVDPFATTSHGVDARTFADSKGHAEVVSIIEKYTSK